MICIFNHSNKTCSRDRSRSTSLVWCSMVFLILFLQKCSLHHKMTSLHGSQNHALFECLFNPSGLRIHSTFETLKFSQNGFLLHSLWLPVSWPSYFLCLYILDCLVWQVHIPFTHSSGNTFILKSRIFHNILWLLLLRQSVPKCDP